MAKRKTTKGKPMLFKFKKQLGVYLRRESETSGKSMVRILEEMLAYRQQFKAWPPKV